MSLEIAYDNLLVEVQKLQAENAHLSLELTHSEIKCDKLREALESQIKVVDDGMINNWPDIASELIRIAREALNVP